MKHFLKFVSLFSFLILFSGCYTYQMSSWNDDDGIYVSSIRNYNYGQYFSDLANDIVEEYEDSGVVDSEDPDNMPWGYKPDQIQIFVDLYPRMYGYGYGGYGYGYGYGGYGYGYGYPYGCGYGYGSPYLCRYYGYGYYGYRYGYPESHYYWPYMNRLRLYPYYYYNRYNNYNGYAYNKDKDYVNTTRLGYSNSSSRRGEKTTSASGSSSNNSSNIRNMSGISISSRSGGYNISSNDVPNLRAIKDTYRRVQGIQRNLNSNSRYINSSRYNNTSQYSNSTRRDMSNSNSRAHNGNYGKSNFSRGSSSNVGSRSSGGSSGGGSRGGSSGGGSRGGGID